MDMQQKITQSGPYCCAGRKNVSVSAQEMSKNERAYSVDAKKRRFFFAEINKRSSSLGNPFFHQIQTPCADFCAEISEISASYKL